MNLSESKPHQWTIREIGQAFDISGGGTIRVEVPRFQRSLVWSEEQRRMLFDSLYRGFPIGAFLAYQTEKKDGNRNVLQIVDGLQRASTINEYLKRPLEFAPVELVFSERFVAILRDRVNIEVEADAESRVLSALEKWMRRVGTTKMGAAFSANSLKHDLDEFFGDGADFDDLIPEINEELGGVQAVVQNVESIAIPVVIYSGDQSNIPSIFERVNNQGTQLSKYEILASSWVGGQTRITNPDIRDAVLARYRVLTDRGYEVVGLPEGSRIDHDQFNLYEYLFGLGKILGTRYPQLFGDSGAADDISPAGFALVTTAMGLRLSRMSDLVQEIRSKSPDPDGPIDLSALEAALFNSVDAVSSALSPFLALQLNKKVPGTLIAHSQNQINSLIAAYLVANFDNDNWIPKSDASGKEILTHLPAHYLIDIVAKRWRGSGDSRLFDVVWSQSRRGPSGYYMEPVKRESLIDALRVWHEEQLTKKQKERANVPSGAQIVLTFLYATLVPVHDNNAIEFELEHIYSVASLMNRIAELRDEEGWPISATGNLMLLPKALNRIKSDATIGDYFADRHETTLSPAESAKLQGYLLWPQVDEVTLASLTDKESFVAFCTKRMGEMANAIADNLKLLR